MKRQWLLYADKPDFANLRFGEEGCYSDFVATSHPRPTPIETIDGRVVGEHEGVHPFTVVRRRGIGVGGTRRPFSRLLPKSSLTAYRSRPFSPL